MSDDSFIQEILKQAKLVDSMTKRGIGYHIINPEYNNWETWGRFHDAVLEVSKVDLSIVQCFGLFHRLPLRIRNIAFDYGFNDTVFGDEVYEYVRDNRDILKGFD